MRKISKTAKLAVVGVSAGTLALSGVAYAYWSTSGSGTGTATTTAGAADLTITQTAAPTDLAPDVAAGAITADVTNNAVNSAYVSQLVVSISSVSAPNADATHPCTAADYAITNGTMIDGAGDLASGDTASFSGATLGFVNSASNQDGCKGATVNLSYVAS